MVDNVFANRQEKLLVAAQCLPEDVLINIFSFLPSVIQDDPAKDYQRSLKKYLSSWLRVHHLPHVLAKSIEQGICLGTCLTDLGAEKREKFIFSISAFVTKIVLYNFCDRGEEFLKYQLCYFFAQSSKQQEFPKRPDWFEEWEKDGVVLGGAGGRYMKGLTVRAKDRGDLFKVWTISNIKKIMPPVSDLLVKEAVVGCEKTLTTERVVEESHTGQFGEILVAVRRTCMELFPPGWTSSRGTLQDTKRHWKVSKPFQCPSVSAHYTTKRADRGALGHILGVNHHRFSAEIDSSIPVIRHPASVAYDCQPSRAPLTPWGDECRVPEFVAIAPPVNRARFKRLLDSSLEDEIDMAVKPVGLKEPFKVRVITCGPEATYYQCRYIQKAVHGHLREHPTFSLIGAPLTVPHIRKLGRLRQGNFFVSGDYKSATDLLNPKLSRLACRVIAENGGWHESWKDLFVRSLTGHRFSTEDQAWGQLMGSPTSFPILCVVNAAVTRLALERWKGMRLSLTQCEMLVNGDDIAFKTNDVGYDIWKSYVKCAGLIPSMGKNFCSPDFVVLNTTMFSYDHSEGDFRLVPYLNFSLLVGRSGKGSDCSVSVNPSSDPRTPDLKTLCNDLIDGFPVSEQERLVGRFIQVWRPILDALPSGMSWFMPQHLGGLGLPLVNRPASESFSYLQLKLARWLGANPSNQSKLMSMASLSKTDDFSLWKFAQHEFERSLPRGYKPSYLPLTQFSRQEVPSPVTHYLASIVTNLSPSHLQELEVDSDERFLTWRETFQKCWSKSRGSTYQPGCPEQAASLPQLFPDYSDLIVLSERTSVRMDLDLDGLLSH